MAQDFSEIIYKSLDSVLKHLNKSEFRHLRGVNELLKIYESVNSATSAITLEAKKYPLIVIEGLDGCGKSTITSRLSDEINGILFCTPPPCIRSVRDEFDSPEYTEVRTAYYALGNYIAAMQMKEMLIKQPVILDRFWHSTAAYAIAQCVNDHPNLYSLPQKDNNIYVWPKDLLQPDFIGFLCVNEEVRMQRLKNRTELTDQEKQLQNPACQLRSHVLSVYKQITPAFQPINGQLSKRKVTNQILEHVKSLLPKNEILE